MKLNDYIKDRCNRIEKVLNKCLPAANKEPKHLHQAMRYAVLNGGKRIRPLLVYATGEAFGANLNDLDIPAAAIELIHCYSLIHDDLPAMDNDDYRRGKPSCHKKFDEATAILAGDALFNLAMQVAATKPELIEILTHASGSFGMAGGQALDLDSVNKQLTLNQLEHMHNLKTGALIRASIKTGAIIGAATSTQLAILDKFAQNIGLAFQVQDDILDSKEIKDNKSTYVALLGIEAAKAKLQQLQQQALQELQNLDIDAKLLSELTDFVLTHTTPAQS